jgi:hypothetical protein
MWEVKRQNRNEVQPMIEALEDRQMMSAAPHAAVAVKQTPAPHAIVMSVKPKATPAVKVAAKPAPAPKPVVKAKAAPAPKPVAKAKVAPAPKPVVTTTPPVGDLLPFVPASNPGMAPNVVGVWSGTMQIDGSKQASPFSIDFAFQHGVAASGTFNLGPTVGNQSAVSTMVFGTNHNVRVLILTSTLWMGFDGALTANGKMIYGRFAVNTPNGWETGSFSVNRN